MMSKINRTKPISDKDNICHSINCYQKI